MDEKDSFWSPNVSAGTLTAKMVEDMLKTPRTPSYWDTKIFVTSRELDLWEKRSPESSHFRTLGPIERYR